MLTIAIDGNISHLKAIPNRPLPFQAPKSLQGRPPYRSRRRESPQFCRLPFWSPVEVFSFLHLQTIFDNLFYTPSLIPCKLEQKFSFMATVGDLPLEMFTK
jgi:hypothetical protein